MKKLKGIIESEAEMKGVDKHVLLENGLYLIIRFHVITTKLVIYNALERCKKGMGFGMYVGEKSGVDYSTIMHEHGATYGHVGAGIPKEDYGPVGSSERSRKVTAAYEKEYQRAYKLIAQGFPEAPDVAKEDGSEMSFGLNKPAAEVFPDLKGEGKMNLKAAIEKANKVMELVKYKPTEGDIEKILIRLRQKLGVTGKPVYRKFLTYELGGSNKYHYFAVFQKGSEFIAANAAGPIGYGHGTVADLGTFKDKQSAIDAAEKKMTVKMKKGYTPVSVGEAGGIWKFPKEIDFRYIELGRKKKFHVEYDNVRDEFIVKS